MKTEEIKFTCTTCKYFKSSGQNKYYLCYRSQKPRIVSSYEIENGCGKYLKR